MADLAAPVGALVFMPTELGVESSFRIVAIGTTVRTKPATASAAVLKTTTVWSEANSVTSPALTRPAGQVQPPVPRPCASTARGVWTRDRLRCYAGDARARARYQSADWAPSATISVAFIQASNEGLKCIPQPVGHTASFAPK